jgi:hypothetical protein
MQFWFHHRLVNRFSVSDVTAVRRRYWFWFMDVLSSENHRKTACCKNGYLPLHERFKQRHFVLHFLDWFT